MVEIKLVECPNCNVFYVTFTSNKISVTMYCPYCRKKGKMIIKNEKK
jgi:Zn-finger nucleic acid-binding protein